MRRQERTEGAGDGLDPYVRSVLSYKPDFYDSPVDFFLAADNNDANVARLATVLCFFRGGVRIHRVPGTHLEILDKNHIHSFSRTFAESLHAAQQRHTPVKTTPPENRAGEGS
jgi:thioesterase domain-containing protein